MLPLNWLEERWRWYWHHFMKGTCFHMPLMALLAVLVVLPFNLFGEEVGIPWLVWHATVWKRFLVGASLAMVAVQALFISYMLWDRARREGRLESDPGPRSFVQFARNTVASLLGTLTVLYLLWMLVGWLSGVDRPTGPHPFAEDPRPTWLKAAVPREVALESEDAPREETGPSEVGSNRKVIGGAVKGSVPDASENGWRAVRPACLIALLPLGALAVFAAVWAAERCQLMATLGGWKLVERGRGLLHRIERDTLLLRERAVRRKFQNQSHEDEPGRTRWRVSGLVIVVAVWVACPVAGATRDERTLVVLTVVAMLGLVTFIATVFCDLWDGWQWRASRLKSQARRAAIAFFLNLLAFLLPVFTCASFALSAWGFWPAAVAALGAGVAVAALAAALPGPAGECLAGVLRARARRAREVDHAAQGVRAARGHSTPPDDADPSGNRPSVQLWFFVIGAGALFFLPQYWVESPGPLVCCFVFGLVVLYGTATVVVRRAIPAVAIGLLFLAVWAGVEPYKYRFDGIEGADYANPLDLDAEAKKDRARQAAFDDAVNNVVALGQQIKALEIKLVQYGEIGELLETRERRARVSRGEPINVYDVWHYAPAKNWKKIEQLIPHYESELQRLENLKQAQQAQQVAAGALWAQMERNNRVIAPHRGGVSNQPDFDFIETDSDGAGRNRPFRARDWKLSDEQKNGPLVVVAVSGGGLRSAAWTFTVLRTLEERFAEWGIDFPGQVRIITGASGGMLGAAYYVATLPTKRDVRNPQYRRDRSANLDRLYDSLTEDHLTPIVRQQVFEDVPSLFTPWATPRDRGKALERSWSRHLDRALDKPFAALREDERAGRIPSLVFSPMMVEDGRRLVVSNLDLRHAVNNDGNLLHERQLRLSSDQSLGLECHSRDALELFRLFPDASRQFRLSTAVRTSASFPIFSPAVSLPVTPRRRVVDAGYYDNYGVNMAAAWLKRLALQREFEGDSSPENGWLRKNAKKVLIVQIRDGVDQPQRKLERIDPDGSTRLTRSAEELSSPFEGLYNARSASSSFRNDDLLGVLDRYVTGFENLANKSMLDDSSNLSPFDRYFQVVNFEFTEQAALSWYLSPAERELVKRPMIRQSNTFDIDYPKRIESIHNWWPGVKKR